MERESGCVTGEFEFAGCASFDLKELEDFGHLEVRRNGRVFDFAVIRDGGPDDGSRFSMDLYDVLELISALNRMVKSQRRNQMREMGNRGP